MKTMQNPFPVADKDRHDVWRMLVERDIEAFVRQDWGMVEGDFLADGFTAVDAGHLDNPDSWRLTFPDLASYRDAWVEQARTMGARVDNVELMDGLYRSTNLRDIDIREDAALAHKKFHGRIVARDGEIILLQWQTLYQCKKVHGRWRIAGFVGYMPYPMGSTRPSDVMSGKQLPDSAAQHTTAGPYSPVLVVTPGQIVVISGQAALDGEGHAIGDTIEAQARYTLDNCRRQLNSTGCDFANVFKATVYLANLDLWERFNDVYCAVMPLPQPVRTAVQAGLLPGLLVEIEMWAVKARSGTS